MAIEVVYSSEVDHIDLVTVNYVEGTTLMTAVQFSGLLQKYPKINEQSYRFSIYGKHAKAGEAVSDGDRVEILRPLTVDPMTARRLRAKKQNQA